MKPVKKTMYIDDSDFRQLTQKKGRTVVVFWPKENTKKFSRLPWHRVDMTITKEVKNANKKK